MSCVLCFFSSRRRHTRFDCDWSSDVCSSDLASVLAAAAIPLTTALLWAGLTWSAVLLLLGVRRLVRIPIGDLSTPFVYAGIGALIVVVVAGAAFLVAERRCRHLAETGQGLGPA